MQKEQLGVTLQQRIPCAKASESTRIFFLFHRKIYIWNYKGGSVWFSFHFQFLMQDPYFINPDTFRKDSAFRQDSPHILFSQMPVIPSLFWSIQWLLSLEALTFKLFESIWPYWAVMWRLRQITVGSFLLIYPTIGFQNRFRKGLSDKFLHSQRPPQGPVAWIFTGTSESASYLGETVWILALYLEPETKVQTP